MGLEKLKDVYDPLSGRAGQAVVDPYENAVLDPGALRGVPPLAPVCDTLASWKDSGPVIRLSEYLRRVDGIKLQRACDGSPVLHFSPGLRRPDLDRQTDQGEAAHNALMLFGAAADDLHVLMSRGLINLPNASRGL
jgi:hypothetical protein